MTITVPLEKWASYGEILKADAPDHGWDILAVLEEVQAEMFDALDRARTPTQEERRVEK